MSWLNFLKSDKHYPEFWQHYLARFKEKKSKYYVAFDCETTGLDPKKDRILSLGVVRLTTERIYIKDNKEWFVKQSGIDNESIKVHGILPSTSKKAILSEKDVLVNFLNYIEDSTLIGHHINFDIAMVNNALNRLNAGKLRNSKKDTNSLYKEQGHYSVEQNFSLDDLCKKYDVKMSNRHTALGDAYITAQIFQHLSQ